ncbi:MAG: nitrous oxide reductase family maturation protein NosD [Candidatus Hodarchaeota archaeon]
MLKKIKNISKSRKKIIFSIATVLFIGLMLSSILLACANTQIASVGDNSSSSNEKAGTTETDISLASIEDAIYIDDTSSNNWQWAKSVGICTGSGTYDDPYVIQFKFINGDNLQSWESCIEIKNSYKHFKITSCVLSNSKWAGIELINTKNGDITGNLLNGNKYGVWIRYSDCGFWHSSNWISDNIFANNEFGICLEESKYNIISNNDGRLNRNGIKLISSNDNWISNNDFSYEYTGSYGILLSNSHNNYIHDNDNNNLIYGIYLVYSDNNEISANTVNEDSFGIYLKESDYNQISGNKVTNNWFGIYLMYSNYNTVSGNIFSGNIIIDFFKYP